jgi:hypothetical protein
MWLNGIANRYARRHNFERTDGLRPTLECRQFPAGAQASPLNHFQARPRNVQPMNLHTINISYATYTCDSRVFQQINTPAARQSCVNRKSKQRIKRIPMTTHCKLTSCSSCKPDIIQRPAKAMKKVTMRFQPLNSA